MANTALITGVTGQDGSYLAELLLAKHYRVVGMVRRDHPRSWGRIAHLEGQIELRVADLLDQASLIRLLENTRPDEVYNLAAQSFVPTSWDHPVLTGEFAALGVTKLLEAIRLVDPAIRFYQASSSEMFGNVKESPQNEHTPFSPRNPYGVAKVYGHMITVNYRDTHGISASSGILFNHESPRRATAFVTRKISRQVALISSGHATELSLGNLEATRDWGFAGDYVVAMWQMLQQDEAQDYVVGTGQAHTVKEFAELAFQHVGLDWQDFVKVDPALVRNAEIHQLVADAGKARRVLKWNPRVDFHALVALMVEADLADIEARGPDSSG